MGSIRPPGTEAKLPATLGFVGHARRTVQRGPRIPVPWIEDVERIAHEVHPTIAIKRGRIAASEYLEPVLQLRTRQVRIDGQGRGRKEIRGGLAVKVHDDLWLPLQESRRRRPRLRLRQREEVTIQVEIGMIQSSRHVPRIRLFPGEGLRTPTAMSVVPDHETLVPVRILTRVKQHDHVFQSGPDRRVITRQKLVENLHAGLEPGGLIPVDRISQPQNERGLRDQLIALAVRQRDTGIRQPSHVRLDLLQAGEVGRGAHRMQVQGPALGRRADPKRAQAVRALRDLAHHPLIGLVGRMKLTGLVAKQRRRARDGCAPRAPGIEIIRHGLNVVLRHRRLTMGEPTAPSNSGQDTHEGEGRKAHAICVLGRGYFHSNRNRAQKSIGNPRWTPSVFITSVCSGRPSFRPIASDFRPPIPPSSWPNPEVSAASSPLSYRFSSSPAERTGTGTGAQKNHPRSSPRR